MQLPGYGCKEEDRKIKDRDVNGKDLGDIGCLVPMTQRNRCMLAQEPTLARGLAKPPAMGRPLQ